MSCPPDLPVLTGVQTVISVIQVELVSCDGDVLLSTVSVFVSLQFNSLHKVSLSIQKQDQNKQPPSGVNWVIES